MPAHDTIQRRRASQPALLLALIASAGAAACAPRALPPPEPAPEPLPPPFAYEIAWTAAPEVLLTGDTTAFIIPRIFTRLDVLDGDTAAVTVRCTSCPDEMVGAVAVADLVYGEHSPEMAAGGSLAEFVASVRQAVGRRELGWLRSVMSPEFTFSFVGQQGPDAAIAAWRFQDFAPLADVAELLDRGLVTRDSALWAAPPAHFETIGYRGPRLGFRRNAEGRWEWVFLLTSLRP